MPKTVFISYANEAMAYSLKRIGRQARKLGVFDEVILYTPSDVPDYVKQSPLFSHPRGAGYWCWKPAIIDMTLQRFEDGTIVVYCDAGCTLRKSSEWLTYIGKMKEYDTLCFQYTSDYPQWKKWGSDSSQLRYWAKKRLLDYMVEYYHKPDIGDLCQIWAGLLFMKRRDNSVLKEWKRLIFSYPELISDPSEEEMKNQYSFFIGHRHDQALLTPLALMDINTLVLPESSENYRKDSFVWASRIRARNWSEYIVIQVKHYLRIWLGDGLFERIKSFLK